MRDYLKAGYPLLWVQTHEEDRAIKSYASEVNGNGYHIYVWDIVGGFKDMATGKAQDMADPLAPLTTALTLPEGSVVFLKDYHVFIENVEIFRTIKNIAVGLKSTDKHLVFISPVLKIPVELEKDITVLEFNLPNVEELETVAKQIVEENELDIEIDRNAVVSGKGLTLNEAENSFALSLVQEKEFSKKVIENEKLQTIRKSGLMELYEPMPESELGGMERLKGYIHNRKKGFYDDNLPTPKGILLVGLPGGGKSLSAKVTASVLDVPLVKLDISSLKGSLVGESEQKMRQALAIIDAVAPCVIWIDEIEKSLGGVQSSSRTDGGTTSSMFGYLLTWMQESTTPKFIVATCNDIGELLTISQGALLRRFDDVFFVDLPGYQERFDIYDIMKRRYGTDNISYDWPSKMDGWTGAEIEKFVVASIYDGEDEAFENIKPIFQQNRDKIEAARDWAKNNARIANSNGENKPGGSGGRKLNLG